ncbi:MULTISPECIES: TonB-dependent receptor [Lysobacter]|uniref:TonB-dependent receptor n=2 Tax=Lysobacter TaxID=68 RepID=A0A0S2DDN3_LYSEN|nr:MULTISPECIES: TonB-dependent receptor [Lysobacter]ALN56710.1 TonB-dependent receptor [Lysobacter enzymogenes]QQQ00008.1 TonB-dependent receptor [Lysobacter enzymogenes]UZW59456.1 TonB-dependent receptor [Lysobacter enzymogenes]WMT03234.1 TonB-dependent receptor [Lysobacter yananisis]
MSKRSLPRLLPLVLSLNLALPLIAQAQDAAHADGDRHSPKDLSAVEVKATPLPGTAEELTRPVEVLAGEGLDRAKANSLGETVSKLPGVQTSYFGPGVGRPIVRGFDGARVQVLSDGLGSGDVSTVSVDHAVTIEPFLADQIEVLKGPATLLYGSGAIGGAVNVVDGRIPEKATEQPLQGRAELRGNTVSDEKTGMVRLDGTSASGHVVFHFDALHRETGDYDIPGYAESRARMAAEGETPDPAEKGVLGNSAVRTDAGSLGISWVGDRGFLGASYSLFNTRYGVPGHSHEHGDDDGHDHGGEEEGEEGPVHIEMDQRRTEVRGGLNDLGPFASLRVKLARTEYTHTEYDGAVPGTVFDNTSTEGRVELVHKPWAGWSGAFGLQFGKRDFRAVGDEAFVPPSQSRDAGLFWIGEREFGPVKLELGARHDRNKIELAEGASGPDRDFDTTSLSASARWNLSDAFHLSFGLDRAQRSPTAEELYSNGTHVATASVELGDARLKEETANRAEIGLHWHNGPLKLSASLYHVRYNDFIYLADTGVEEHDGPVRLWTQGDARFNGAEAEADWTFLDNDSGAWGLRVFGDVVRGKLAGSGSREVDFSVAHGDHTHDYTADIAQGGNLPRIAPWRVGGELRWDRGPWRASLGAVRYARQDRVAEHETQTPGYTLVDAHVAWHADTPAGNAWEVFLDGSNLLDKEARAHTSFLKDVAPLPGRGVAFGVRMFF